jgi:hypothetical protein
VEVSATRGTKALVDCLINSSLFTGTVQTQVVEYSTSNWPDGHQACSQLSTGLPPSCGLGWEEKRSEVQPLGRCPLTRQVRVCGGCEGAAGPGHAKTSLPGRKTVPGLSRGGTRREGEETSRSENETRLVAAGLPGYEPGGLQRRRGLPGVASAAVQALRRLTATTSSRDSTLIVKELGPWRRTA